MTTKVPIELSSTPSIVDGGNATAITIDSSENSTFSGVVTANAGVVVDNITIDGTEIDLSSGDLTIDVAGDLILDAGGDDFRFDYGGTTHLYISNNSGNTTIQTAISDEDLVFKGNDGGSTITALTLDMSSAGFATFNSGITIAGSFWLNDGASSVGYMYSDSNDFVIRSYSQDKDIIFKGNDGGSVIEAMRIDMSAGGKLGIGTNSPQELLHVHHGSGSSKVTISGEGNNNKKCELGYDSGDGPYLMAGSSGINSLKFYTDRTGHRMTIDGSGNIGAPTGTNIYNASDERLKQNITSLDNSLDIIKNLNPVKFNWIDNFSEPENGKTLYGFVAQEVQKVSPDIVESFGDGSSVKVDDKVIENPLTVREKFLVPMLVKAIQELSTELETAKARIKTLEDA